VEVNDPLIGPIAQVGRVYEIQDRPIEIVDGPPAPGQHTAEVLAEAATEPKSAPVPPASRQLAHPLDGITVLDFGLAVAGPYGGQLLADLGANVIKVNRPGEEFWMSTTWGMLANRGKQSIGLDLKQDGAQQILRRLVTQADVVMHNMRSDAAARIGVDEPTLRKINPSLVYCHTRGHDRGERESLPGNDQTAGAIAGTQWADGGVDGGGAPLWPCISLGDPGNGLLAAIGIVQAIYERDRTGKGQSVDTSILNAHLLNNSSAWIAADGSDAGNRPRLDRMQLGWSALYRLYETSSGWLCLAVNSEEQWQSLSRVAGLSEILSDPRFGSAGLREAHDEELVTALSQAFKRESAQVWFQILDGLGVPCEISTPDFVLSVFDDEEFIAKEWVTTYDHPWVGKLEAAGLLFDFSATPGRIAGPPFIPGQHTREILQDLGYSDPEISRLLEAGAAFLAGPA
jgi:crotonobetainyl-CoA:carnitine CoA-transferase CaiB-like acyl-CoA transferase